VGDPLALLAAKLEPLDWTDGQLGKQTFEAIDRVERSQHPDEGDELGAAAGFDALEGALADAGLLGELGLRQVRFDAVPLDSFAQDLGYGCVGQIRCDSHYSPLMTIKKHIARRFVG